MRGRGRIQDKMAEEEADDLSKAEDEEMEGDLAVKAAEDPITPITTRGEAAIGEEVTTRGRMRTDLEQEGGTDTRARAPPQGRVQPQAECQRAPTDGAPPRHTIRLNPMTRIRGGPKWQGTRGRG